LTWDPSGRVFIHQQELHLVEPQVEDRWGISEGKTNVVQLASTVREGKCAAPFAVQEEFSRHLEPWMKKLKENLVISSSPSSTMLSPKASILSVGTLNTSCFVEMWLPETVSRAIYAFPRLVARAIHACCERTPTMERIGRTMPQFGSPKDSGACVWRKSHVRITDDLLAKILLQPFHIHGIDSTTTKHSWSSWEKGIRLVCTFTRPIAFPMHASLQSRHSQFDHVGVFLSQLGCGN
jgi:hypothetical protein